jgi:hypothetical protein
MQIVNATNADGGSRRLAKGTHTVPISGLACVWARQGLIKLCH